MVHYSSFQRRCSYWATNIAVKQKERSSLKREICQKMIRLKKNSCWDLGDAKKVFSNNCQTQFQWVIQDLLCSNFVIFCCFSYWYTITELFLRSESGQPSKQKVNYSGFFFNFDYSNSFAGSGRSASNKFTNKNY